MWNFFKYADPCSNNHIKMNSNFIYTYMLLTPNYISLSKEDTIQAVKHIEVCVAEIQERMGMNKHKLSDKTEIIVIGMPHIKN